MSSEVCNLLKYPYWFILTLKKNNKKETGAGWYHVFLALKFSDLLSGGENKLIKAWISKGQIWYKTTQCIPAFILRERYLVFPALPERAGAGAGAGAAAGGSPELSPAFLDRLGAAVAGDLFLFVDFLAGALRPAFDAFIIAGFALVMISKS